MPRFFLNIRDRKIGMIVDPEGEEAEDVGAVRRIAEETIQDIISRPQVYGSRRIWRYRVMEVVDESGHLVLTLPFASIDAPP
ncbi:MAG: hypothetical protein K2Y56_26115 [Methylobacterium sp.]|uniref:DUF6894 family protein n=1 Tax=Methylobacterium sp. TaxID=409 RepID=UPI0025D7915C|nr:hypothetical protein [Methylobacterium sp.]MBX9934941.1 hypothetical protein [Methylobacterium sp.]